MLCIKSQENERFLNGLYILMGMGICRLPARRDGEVMVTTMKVQTSEDGFWMGNGRRSYVSRLGC